MARENVEIVKRLDALYRAGRLDEVVELHAEDVGGEASHFPEGRVYRGHDGVRAFFRRYGGTWSTLDVEFEEMFDAGDKVVVFARDRGLGRASGAPVEFVYAQVITVRDGKIAHWQAFTDREAALKAAGLSQ
jgi:uncharacterized protein